MSIWHLTSRHSSPIFNPDTGPDIPPPVVDPDTDAQLSVCRVCGWERGRTGAGGRAGRKGERGAGGRGRGGDRGRTRDA